MAFLVCKEAKHYLVGFSMMIFTKIYDLILFTYVVSTSLICNYG